MKRITQRTLIEFDAPDKTEVRRMFDKAATLRDTLWHLIRVFTEGTLDSDTGEWTTTHVKNPTMSRQKLLNDLEKVEKRATELAAQAYDFRVKVLES